jgi:hypothetical protein
MARDVRALSLMPTMMATMLAPAAALVVTSMTTGSNDTPKAAT